MNRRNFVKILVAAPVAAHAATPFTGRTPAILAAMAANGKQLAGYQWKQKTTVLRKGQSVAVTVDDVRIGADGHPHRVNLVRPEEKRMGPIKAHKVAEVKSDIEESMRLAQ